MPRSNWDRERESMSRGKVSGHQSAFDGGLPCQAPGNVDHINRPKSRTVLRRMRMLMEESPPATINLQGGLEIKGGKIIWDHLHFIWFFLMYTKPWEVEERDEDLFSPIPYIQDFSSSLTKQSWSVCPPTRVTVVETRWLQEGSRLPFSPADNCFEIYTTKYTMNIQ